MFTEAAAELGAGIARGGRRLVFGAGGGGLMGAVARAALAAGGTVTGSVPEFLTQLEVPVPGIENLRIVETMAERKRILYDESDAFVVLPGGLGTLDEVCETFMMRQLNRHAKPLVLINLQGYWDPLLTMVRQTVHRGFADARILDAVHTVDDVPAALRYVGI